jgi:hypothetical protein
LRTKQWFHLGEILSVTTGRLVAPSGMAGVHALLDYMTGDTLFTHQLPRAVDHCAPALLEQHPDLVGVDLPDGVEGADPVAAWLAQQVATFGTERAVAPALGWLRKNPLTELVEMAPGKPIIAVELPASGEGAPRDEQ